MSRSTRRRPELVVEHDVEKSENVQKRSYCPSKQLIKLSERANSFCAWRSNWSRLLTYYCHVLPGPEVNSHYIGHAAYSGLCHLTLGFASLLHAIVLAKLSATRRRISLIKALYATPTTLATPCSSRHKAFAAPS